MHENPTLSPAEQDCASDSAILGLLSKSDEQRPWSVDKVTREIGNHGATVDGLARLYGAGLIQPLRRLCVAYPRRVALRAEELSL